MACQRITYENHKVEVDGMSISAAMLSGLHQLHWVKVNGRAILRGRMATAALFSQAMGDPEHLFHPHPCTCATTAEVGCERV